MPVWYIYTIFYAKELYKMARNNSIFRHIGLKQIIVGIAAIGLCIYIYSTSTGKVSPTVDVLRNTARNINKNCPQSLGHGTQLDSAMVETEPRLTFKFNYTFVNLAAESVDVDSMWNEFRPAQIKNTRTSKDMQYLRENSVTVAYVYHDKNGRLLFDVVVPPELYND